MSASMNDLKRKNTDSRLYQSYMLRLWRESRAGDWRASLENVFTGERRLFSDIAEMFVYLCARTGRSAPQRPAQTTGLEKHKEDPS
jgi:hypothetical protein